MVGGGEIDRRSHQQERENDVPTSGSCVWAASLYPDSLLAGGSCPPLTTTEIREGKEDPIPASFPEIVSPVVANV